MLTQKKLKELLKYDPKTGVFTWLVSPTSTVKCGDIAGTISHGYVSIRIDTKAYRAHRLAWLYVHGYIPEGELDHINRVITDNRLSNLREVSHQCNMRNSKLAKDNTSGVKGVTKDPKRGLWQAGIQVNKRFVYLGAYADFTEAVCHRLAGEQALNWSGCDSSSPAYLWVKANVNSKCR